MEDGECIEYLRCGWSIQAVRVRSKDSGAWEMNMQQLKRQKLEKDIRNPD